MRKYAIWGTATSPEHQAWVREIGKQFEAADFVQVDDIADADFVLNMFDPEDPKAFRRASRGKNFEFIRQSLLKSFGPLGSATRAENDLLKLTREVSAAGIKSLPVIYLDCGTEDILFPSNRSYADLLVERKIPHEFRQLPGNHNWQYWDQQVREILNLAARNLAPPK